MTREEAIRILKPLVNYVNLSKYEKEAVKLAIVALERWNGRNTEVIVIDEQHREEYGPFDLDNY